MPRLVLVEHIDRLEFYEKRSRPAGCVAATENLVCRRSTYFRELPVCNFGKSPVYNPRRRFEESCDIVAAGSWSSDNRSPKIREERAVNLIVLLIILFVLFGGGGYYVGGPAIGGSLGGIILIVLVVLLLTGRL